MRSRILTLAVLVGVVAVALVAAVAMAGVDRSDPLPTVSAADLLAKMARADGPDAISGEVAWRNALFGDIGAASALGHLPAQSPLTSSGSGRVWLSHDGFRAESQGGGGDQVVVVDKQRSTVWVHDSSQNTVRKLTSTGERSVDGVCPASGAAVATPDAIGVALQQVAPLAAVEVAGQARVAGRAAYMVRATPAARDTALGSVEVAVDGETMTPLRLDVYARNGVEPVLRYGFTSVSYRPVDPKLFLFIPPAGAQVTDETVDGAGLRDRPHVHDGPATESPTVAQKKRALAQVGRAHLDLRQVRRLVPFRLAWARDQGARPLRGGFLWGSAGPLTDTGTPLIEALAGILGWDVGWALGGAGDKVPLKAGSSFISVLLYGDGFGTVVLLQTKTTPELEQQFEQAAWGSQLLGPATVNGAEAVRIGTPLGGLVAWQRGRTTLVAVGMVPMSDLEAFAGSVR